jgi:hypothetical protein
MTVPPAPDVATALPSQIRAAEAPEIREVSAATVEPTETAPRDPAERIAPSFAIASLQAPHREGHREDDDDDEARPRKRTCEMPEPHDPADLRALVGKHARCDAVLVALGWAKQLGARVGGPSGGELVAWARRKNLLAPATEAAAPGDLLVFDRTEGDGRAELVGVVVGRDLRGVTEFVYLGGEFVRRGFVDAAHPSVQRDASGAVVNTYLRHCKRAMPPRGTRYLAGELLAHVIHVR